MMAEVQIISITWLKLREVLRNLFQANQPVNTAHASKQYKVICVLRNANPRASNNVQAIK